MDLSDPLGVTTPTLDGPVLAALVRSGLPLSGREVHRLAAEGSPSGVHKVLKRLVGQGIVRANERPAETLYEFNRDHLAAEGIEAIVRAPEALVDFLRVTVQSWVPAPGHASLFGSFARGEAAEGSDVDMLLVRIGRATETWERGVTELQERVYALTGNALEVLEWSLTELRGQRGTTLLRQLMGESILLVGEPLDRIVHGPR